MPPTVTATISKEWKQRMLMITVIVAGAGAWFLYDGLWAWPQNNVRWAVYAPLKAQHGEETAELEKAWVEAARERGWSETPPKKEYKAGDLLVQKIIAAVAFLAAILCLRHYFTSLKTTTRLENAIIYLPDGREVPLDKVRAVSLRRWKSKGIADLAYEAEPGRMKKFPLDDYKYVGAEKILEEVQARLPREPAAAQEPGPTGGNY
jgi:hypothetical protein